MIRSENKVDMSYYVYRYILKRLQHHLMVETHNITRAFFRKIMDNQLNEFGIGLDSRSL